MNRRDGKLAVNLKFKSPGEVSEEEEIAIFERVFQVLEIFEPKKEVLLKD